MFPRLSPYSILHPEVKSSTRNRGPRLVSGGHPKTGGGCRYFLPAPERQWVQFEPGLYCSNWICKDRLQCAGGDFGASGGPPTGRLRCVRGLPRCELSRLASARGLGLASVGGPGGTKTGCHHPPAVSEQGCAYLDFNRNLASVSGASLFFHSQSHAHGDPVFRSLARRGFHRSDLLSP